MDLTSPERFAILTGPHQQAVDQLDILQSFGALQPAWCHLFSQPLTDLVTDRRTGNAFDQPMQWMLFDRDYDRKVLSVYLEPTRNEIVIQYHDALATTPHPAKMAFIDTQQPVVEIDKVVLASYNQQAHSLQLQEPYLRIAAAALAYYNTQDAIDGQKPYKVVYESKHDFPEEIRHAHLWKYFDTPAAAATSLLLGDLKSLPPVKYFGQPEWSFQRIVMLDNNLHETFLRIATNPDNEAILHAQKGFYHLRQSTGIDLSEFHEGRTFDTKMTIGHFADQHMQHLQPNEYLERWRIDQLTASTSNRDTPEQQWNFKIQYRLQEEFGQRIPSDCFMILHENTGAQALRRLLQVPLVDIDHFVQTHSKAVLSSASGWDKATLLGEPHRQPSDGSPPRLEVTLDMDAEFMRSLPQPIQPFLSQKMQVATIAEGKLHWSAEAIALRTALDQYVTNRAVIEKGILVPALQEWHQSNGPYVMQLHYQPLSNHYLEPKPPQLFTRYQVANMDHALQALSALQLDHFSINHALQNGHNGYVEAVTLFTDRQRTPLFVATGSQYSDPPSNLTVLVAEKDLNSQEMQKLRTKAMEPDLKHHWQFSFCEKLDHYRQITGQLNNRLHYGLRSVKDAAATAKKSI